MKLRKECREVLMRTVDGGGLYTVPYIDMHCSENGQTAFQVRTYRKSYNIWYNHIYDIRTCKFAVFRPKEYSKEER